MGPLENIIVSFTSLVWVILHSPGVVYICTNIYGRKISDLHEREHEIALLALSGRGPMKYSGNIFFILHFHIRENKPSGVPDRHNSFCQDCQGNSAILTIFTECHNIS